MPIELDDDAPRRRRKKPTGIPAWGWIAIGIGGAGSVLFLFLVLTAGCGKKTKDDSPAELAVPQTPSPQVASSGDAPQPVALADLAGAYQNNEIAANKKYKGKRLVMDVAPTDFGEGKTGKPFFMASSGALGNVSDAAFGFSPADSNQISSLKKGQRIRVEGFCDGISPSGELRLLVFRDCKIISLK